MAPKTDPVKKKKRSSPKKKNRKRRAKTLLAKAKPFALPGGALLGLGAPYLKRAEGTDIGIFDLIKEDLTNFDMAEASKRLQAQAGAILMPGIAGMAVKHVRIAGKASSLVADLLLGLAIGTAAKALIDPPQGTTDTSLTQSSIIDMQKMPNGVYGVRTNLYA